MTKLNTNAIAAANLRLRAQMLDPQVTAKREAVVDKLNAAQGTVDSAEFLEAIPKNISPEQREKQSFEALKQVVKSRYAGYNYPEKEVAGQLSRMAVASKVDNLATLIAAATGKLVRDQADAATKPLIQAFEAEWAKLPDFALVVAENGRDTPTLPAARTRQASSDAWKTIEILKQIPTARHDSARTVEQATRQVATDNLADEIGEQVAARVELLLKKKASPEETLEVIQKARAEMALAMNRSWSDYAKIIVDGIDAVLKATEAALAPEADKAKKAG